MNKVIFLDIDGVLNNHTKIDHELNTQGYCSIDPRCALTFNYLLKKTKANVVLSSAWRYMILKEEMTLKGFNYLLITHGIFCNLIGHTCSDELLPERSDQIQSWVHKNLPIHRYVVLDDLTISNHPQVFVDGNRGLTPTNALQAIKILNG